MFSPSMGAMFFGTGTISIVMVTISAFPAVARYSAASFLSFSSSLSILAIS